MKKDSSEQHNLYSKHPSLVSEMTTLMQSQIDNGRSTPGLRQQNALSIKLLK
jgi:hypothetical protein